MDADYMGEKASIEEREGEGFGDLGGEYERIEGVNKLKY